ncbi:hypothetical protein [Streptomyces lavendofoliae]|uniref:Uncharacterized protein n=1 Tax=Streptomyces lavendofoliae TaxID=67314 RepID=A0A918I232_9ACTN|nr:hypothetical protein [Streptomyces lavendofoliae]GGU52428.1 hypothetical protein GCM10010274_46690 [Streptomyces lavendofoliae]
MSDRMKKQAEQNRAVAKELRNRDKNDAAKRYEDRAAELESGRVTDVTDSVSRLISWGFGR